MKEQYRRIAPDSSVINFKVKYEYNKIDQGNSKNRRQYQAIEKLFELQSQDQIVLVALEQVDKEIRRTSCEELRGKLIETLGLCKETCYLTRFESRSPKSKRASKARGKNGITFPARFEDDNDDRKINEYNRFSDVPNKQRDLEIVATAAIARVKVVVFVDKPFLSDQKVKDFAKQKDDIEICTPTQVIKLLAQENIGLS